MAFLSLCDPLGEDDGALVNGPSSWYTDVMEDSIENAQSAGSKSYHYQVVARRYRPQTLVGQSHVAQALSNAMASWIRRHVPSFLHFK